MTDRHVADRALLRARLMAYDAGEFVGQESFMRASEILELAQMAGIAPGVSVLDLCCGVAGPGRFLTRELGCAYLGVDGSRGAIDIARERAADLACRFEVARIPPLPPGPFDVVLLLETMLAFPDKEELLGQVSAVLPVGGRFAFTVEEGLPLTSGERAAMPNADTVWPVPLEDLHRSLARHGLAVRRQIECTDAHRKVAESLLGTITAEAPQIEREIGRAVDDLLSAHRLWTDWLRSGRVRKYAVVAEKAVRPERTNAAS